MITGLNIVIAEHQRLSAILSCLSGIATAGAEKLGDAELETVDALLSYIEAFVYQFHHPKEDQYLFPAIAQRCPHTIGHIRELESQHQSGTDTIHALQGMIQQVKSGDRSQVQLLLDQLYDYTRFETEHMTLENSAIFPEARHLSEEQRQKIEEAFSDHDDPLFGDKASGELRRRFSEIISKAPAPYGLADPHPQQTETSAWQSLKQLMGL